MRALFNTVLQAGFSSIAIAAKSTQRRVWLAWVIGASCCFAPAAHANLVTQLNVLEAGIAHANESVNWNLCVAPNPVVFSSPTDTPTVIQIGGGINTDGDGNECDIYDLGLYPTNDDESGAFTTFTTHGTSGATYTFDFLPCNFVTSGGPGSGGCSPDGSASLNTYYGISVSQPAPASDTVTVYMDPTSSGNPTQPVVLAITINLAKSTTTTIGASVNPATFPQSETFTATVTSTSTVSESTVAFTSGGTTISGCGAVPVSNGAATCTTQLSAGSHSIVAVFHGDANFATSTSSTLTETINAAVTATQQIAAQTLTQNNSIAASFVPVLGAGGTGSLTYGVSPSLPPGLSLSGATGRITGIPTGTLASTTFTVTVTDVNSQTASNTFSLKINAQVLATQSIASIALTQNHASTSFTPVTGSGGTPALTYGVSPTLPTGLSMSASTGAISGTATVTRSATTYSVTVTDANGATAQNTFVLSVNAAVTATQAVASKTLTQNQAAPGFTPVTGSGGTGALVYSVSPPLPNGLIFSTTTGAISGNPTVTLAATTFTVTVTDQNSATASNTFSLTVTGAVTATQVIPSETLTQNHAAPFTPVTGAGGATPLVYSVSPTLPTGLTISPSTGAITGTPTVTLAATTFTVTITDQNNAAASNTFSLTINPAVTATQAIASKALTQNQASTAFMPVTGAGGTGILSYSISPTLPNGLSLSSSTGFISGSPTAALASTTFTVTVTDANGATATATFSLTVNAQVSATQQVSSATVTANHTVTPFTPVSGSGGTPPLTYSISPTLPGGLSISSTNGLVSGTPTVASAQTIYTVTITDANGATASSSFNLTVVGPVVATTVIANKGLTVNFPVSTPFIPVQGSGGTGTLTYSETPTLPPGIAMNNNTGGITGLPTATSSATTYTVTVTDQNGATATATFVLSVNGSVNAATVVASTTLTAGQTSVSFVPVTGGGGTTPYSFSVSPTLPAGLALSSSTGAVTGSPTTATAARSYTVTVTDQNGATATAGFSLTVSPSVTATTVVASTTLTQNVAAALFTPVTGGAGTGALTYSVSPILPAGLSISAATGAISGTPTATTAATNYTATVTDANGDTATAGFSLTVNGAVMATTVVASTNLTQDALAASFTPVAGSGGTGTLAYSISPVLPAGLSFDPTSGAISGTPTAASATTTYTVTVTDTNNATASATFSLSVNTSVTAAVSVASVRLIVNEAASPVVPVTGSGGTGTLSYSISPVLPAGLSFDPTTGTISGIATAITASATYTVTVTDSAGGSASASFTLGVVAAASVVATPMMSWWALLSMLVMLAIFGVLRVRAVD
jgi:Bacterial Ig-like domain (group 3)/Putative Ig domain